MPTLVVLATVDPSLADAWEAQIPAGRITMRLDREGSIPPTPSLAAVVILDSFSEAKLPTMFARCPTIYVGEPRSLPYEQARMLNRAKVYLSYDDSRRRLTDFFSLLEEIAEKQCLLEIVAEKGRRQEPVRQFHRGPNTDGAELWDFLEGIIENIDTRDRLLSEFRRASRQVLRASHAVFFLREPDGFRADRGTSFFGLDDALVLFFERHPVVVDGTSWDSVTDPVAELAVRNRLALWGARLLVPIHDNGRLLGMIALGVRDDGAVYEESDRTRAVYFARLLRHCLGKNSHFGRLNHVATQVNLGSKYLPGTLVLGPDDSIPKHVPLVVRDLIGQARRTREISRVTPTMGQPFRASAGIIAETGGAWAFWEEASSEVHETLKRERKSRISMLRELALTLNHELGNALVSLTTFRQAGADRPMPPALIQTVKSDVAQLEHLNTNLALMQSLHEAEPTCVDIREVAQTVGDALGIRVEVGSDPIVLLASKTLLEFTLRSFIGTLAENSPNEKNELTLKVRSTGKDRELTALLSVKGKNLELEGILPEPVDDGVPNQGRISVFLAKEILRLHHGEIHAGPGLESVEILFSLRSL